MDRNILAEDLHCNTGNQTFSISFIKKDMLEVFFYVKIGIL